MFAQLALAAVKLLNTMERLDLQHLFFFSQEMRTSPSDVGFGTRMSQVASGIGMIKTGIDIGRTLWNVGKTVAPIAGAMLAL